MNQQRRSQRGLTAFDMTIPLATIAIVCIAAFFWINSPKSTGTKTPSPPVETTLPEATVHETTPSGVIDVELELLGDDEPSPDATITPASAPGESIEEPEPVTPHADPILPAVPLEEPAVDVETTGAKPALRD